MPFPHFKSIKENTILFFILSSTKSVSRKSGVSLLDWKIYEYNMSHNNIKYSRAQVTQRAPRATEISDARTYFPLLNVYHAALKFENIC